MVILGWEVGLLGSLVIVLPVLGSLTLPRRQGHATGRGSESTRFRGTPINICVPAH
ncbi:MAG: hypothetical protein JWO69_1620 [Thermoleophilia bacterium]|jgi:hypothetical protein|nr:hypothetical protein [Thermoleophilia bacterium]